MSHHLAHRALSALAVAAAAGVLSVAPAHAQLPVPPDPGPVTGAVNPTPLPEDSSEVLQIALGVLGGAALSAAAAGALSRRRHPSAAHA